MIDLNNMKIKFPLTLERFFLDNFGERYPSEGRTKSKSSLISSSLKDLELLKKELEGVKKESSKFTFLKITPENLNSLQVKIDELSVFTSEKKNEKLRLLKTLAQWEKKILDIERQKFSMKEGNIKKEDVFHISQNAANLKTEISSEIKRINLELDGILSEKDVVQANFNSADAYLKKNIERLNEYNINQQKIRFLEDQIKSEQKKILDLKQKDNFLENQDFSLFVSKREDIKKYILNYTDSTISFLKLNLLRQEVLQAFDIFFSGGVVNLTSKNGEDFFTECLGLFLNDFFKKE